MKNYFLNYFSFAQHSNPIKNAILTNQNGIFYFMVKQDIKNNYEMAVILLSSNTKGCL